VDPDTPGISHRERKRARTWTAIHLAAANAAATHERLADVTVESVAEDAGVPPRTFFNYFRSKEDAILGLRPAVVDEALAASFTVAPDDDLVEKVAFLLLEVYRTVNGSQIPHPLHDELMDRHPELARRRVRYIDDVQTLTVGIAASALSESPWWTSTRPARSADDTAVLLVAVAGAILRTAMRPVVTRAGVTESDAADALRAACSLFREVTHP